MDDFSVLPAPDRSVPIVAPADLHRLWSRLTGQPKRQRRSASGDGRDIWLALLDQLGHLLDPLVRFEAMPRGPERVLTRRLVRVATEASTPRGSAAFLLHRPGASEPARNDVAWEAAIGLEAKRQGLRIRPTYLATDEGVVPLHVPAAA